MKYNKGNVKRTWQVINLKSETFVFILSENLYDYSNATHWTNSISQGTIAVPSVDQLNYE